MSHEAEALKALRVALVGYALELYRGTDEEHIAARIIQLIHDDKLDRDNAMIALSELDVALEMVDLVEQDPRDSEAMERAEDRVLDAHTYLARGRSFDEHTREALAIQSDAVTPRLRSV